jgi:hypothetical protein
MQVQNSIFKIEKKIKLAKIFDMRHHKTKIGFHLEVALFFSKLFPTQILHKFQVCAICKKREDTLKIGKISYPYEKIFPFQDFPFWILDFLPNI